MGEGVLGDLMLACSAQLALHMSYSLNSLKRVLEGTI